MTRYLSSIGAFMLLLPLPATALAERPDEPSKPAGEESEPETVTIPLDQIWAYRMPGTRDVQQLEKDRERSGRSLVALLSESLVLHAEKLGGRGPARPGFAVKGTGLSALQAAHEVLAEGARPRNEFSSDDEVTVVFFSDPFTGRYIHIQNVELRGNEVDVTYRGEPYAEKHLSLAIALIPLGQLAEGKYLVTMTQLPLEEKYIKWGVKPREKEWSQQFVCRPFSFCVVDNEVEAN